MNVFPLTVGRDEIGSRRAARRPEAPVPQCRQAGARSFAARTILAGRGACEQARRLAGRRLLTADAPMLPLANCGHRCTCSYKCHPDRRDEEPRRGIDVGISGAYYIGAERRRVLERRARVQRRDSYFDVMRESGGRGGDR